MESRQRHLLAYSCRESALLLLCSIPRFMGGHRRRVSNARHPRHFHRAIGQSTPQTIAPRCCREAFRMDDAADRGMDRVLRVAWQPERAAAKHTAPFRAREIAHGSQRHGRRIHDNPGLRRAGPTHPMCHRSLHGEGHDEPDGALLRLELHRKRD